MAAITESKLPNDELVLWNELVDVVEAADGDLADRVVNAVVVVVLLNGSVNRGLVNDVDEGILGDRKGPAGTVDVSLEDTK